MEGLAAAVGQRQECAEQDDQAGDVQQDATNSVCQRSFSSRSKLVSPLKTRPVQAGDEEAGSSFQLVPWDC